MTVHYFGISIAQVATWVLGTQGARLRTRLVLREGITSQSKSRLCSRMQQQGGISAPDLGSSAASIADQLGLKLEPSKGQVETLVIDHVERPSPN